MMTLLRPATSARMLLILLLVVVVDFPKASALVAPQQNISSRRSLHRHKQPAVLRKINCYHDVRRRITSSSSSCTPQRSLNMMMMVVDPTDQHSLYLLDHHLHTSSTTFDLLSSFTLAKASSVTSVVPNQSIAPLSETIQSIFDASTTTDNANNNLLEVIPDLPSMPGGVPRSGNAFLSGSFRDLYQAPIVTPNPKMISQWNNNNGIIHGDGSMVVPSRELDVVARYADLLSRIPPMAAAYALFDFFVVNAEEDLALAELLAGDDDDENDEAVVEAIMAVENQVVMQRFMGLFAIVIATVMWSLLSYHPVPFNEL